MVEGLYPVLNDFAKLFVAQSVKVVVEERVSGTDVSNICKGSCMGDLVCPTDTTNQHIEIMLSGEVAESICEQWR